MIECDKRVILAADAEIQQNDTQHARLEFKLHSIAPDLDDKAVDEALRIASLNTCAELGIGADGKIDRNSINLNIKEAIRENRDGVRQNLLKNFEKEVQSIKNMAKAREQILEIAKNWLEENLELSVEERLPNKEALELALDDTIDILQINSSRYSMKEIHDKVNINIRKTSLTLAARYDVRAARE